MNNRVLVTALVTGILSLSGLTMYAQGYFGPMFGGMPSQGQQQQMFQMYQEQMRSYANPPAQQQAESRSATDESSAPSDTCSSVVSPVCGTDGVTYANECLAQKQGVSVASQGKCAPQQKQVQDESDQPSVASAQQLVDAAKKSKKKKPAKKASKQFSVGPGQDKEIFTFSASGTGELVATITWTGSAQALQVEVMPQAMPEKKENNELGLRTRTRVRAATMISDTDTAIENSDDLASGAYVAQAQSPSPTEATLELTDDTPGELMVAITSFEGEAVGTLELSGDIGVSNLAKRELDSEGLDASGKILVPLVMYQLDRYFKNPPQKNSLDTKIANHLSNIPLAHDKLKVAVNRFNALGLAKKKSLFNSNVVTALQSAGGQALSPQKIAEIKNLLASTLPPASPKDLGGAVTLTDPDAQTAGKKLKLNWKHSGAFTDKYLIERAPRQIIEQILNLTELQFEPYKEYKKPKRGGWGKVATRKFELLLNNNTDYPELYCYRVRAWNAKGYSDYTNHFCPEMSGVSTVSQKFNVKWTHLHSIEEADVDGFSNSDEPYLLFTMINGKNADNTPKTWVRKWDASDDVDSGETEPDDERASFTLFGEPPTDAAQDLIDLKSQLANTDRYIFENGVYSANPEYVDILYQIRNHAWGSKHIRNDDMPADIDLHTGLIIATTIMEEDAGAHITLEEQIKAGIQAAQDIAEAFMDPSGVSVAIAIKSTIEFMYKMWANDDFVGTETWRLTFTGANELVNPPSSSGAYLKELDIDGGGDGHYTVGMCLYKENTSAYTIQQGCGIAQNP